MNWFCKGVLVDSKANLPFNIFKHLESFLNVSLENSNYKRNNLINLFIIDF
ncbi:MAG: hypothetical protein BAJALOKI2v1_320024 [Promethearchaeota archaeon]|nr:MAG: hypothetical protein BAJALOKI2v1_320024 [Candidatus Lokiarchaeota archaeon]